jgi:hypothetical protein
MKTISTRTYRLKQSWFLQKTVEDYDQVVKVVIERNAYDSQSSGKTYFWNGKEWSLVCNVPVEFLQCKSISYVNDGITERHFETDVKLLLEETFKIL